MYCRYCGSIIKEGSNYCINCGKKIDSQLPYQKDDNLKQSNVLPGNGGYTQNNPQSPMAQAALNLPLKAGKEVVNGSKKVLHRCISIGLVIILIGAAIIGYFTFYVPSPEDVVEECLDACDNLDIKAVIECLDPASQRELNSSMAVGKVASGIFGSISGIDIDYDALISAMPALLGASGEEVEKINATDFKVISISGDKFNNIVSKYGTTYKWLGNILGTEAIVQYRYKENGHTKKATVRVCKYGKDGWKIDGKSLDD